jgi:hypothetical protein
VGLTKRRERDDEPVEEITLRADRSGHVYDMFTGAYLGETEAWTVAVSNADVRLYSVLPYKVNGLTVTTDGTSAKRGGMLRGTIALVKGRGRPVRHVFHVEAIRPDGRRARYMRRNVSAVPGVMRRLLRSAPSASFTLPIALNEMTGRWTLRVTDVASRTTQEATVLIE